MKNKSNTCENRYEGPKTQKVFRDISSSVEKKKITNKKIITKNYQPPQPSQQAYKDKNELILSVPNLDTRIDKKCFLNEKEIIIKPKIIMELNIDSVLYDVEMLKISSSKYGLKKVIRYLQLTKTEFKYYNSVFSSSVWNDKPLFRTSIHNIDRITVGSNDVTQLMFEDIKFSFKIYFKELDGVITFLEFGCEDVELGVAFIKVLLLLKNYK
jgi:hypothetical protein